MSNTPSLLQCPFCGGINIIHCGHHMYCHACGADGPDAAHGITKEGGQHGTE